MITDQQLTISDESFLPEDVVSRCRALNMTQPQMRAVADLNAMYECPSSEIVGYVENSISLPKVAECLRLRHELQELSGADVETINQYVELIDFHSPNEIEHFDAEGRLIYNGRAMTAEQREDILLQEILGGDKTAQVMPGGPIISYPHDKIIETLLEGSEDAFSESDDPVKELLEKIKAQMDGNILMAYHLCVDQPNEYRLFLRGKIDLHHLHFENPNPGDDYRLNTEF